MFMACILMGHNYILYNLHRPASEPIPIYLWPIYLWPIYSWAITLNLHSPACECLGKESSKNCKGFSSFDSERVEVPECGSGQMAEILGQIVPPTTQAHAAIYSGMLKFTEISAHTEIH